MRTTLNKILSSIIFNCNFLLFMRLFIDCQRKSLTYTNEWGKANFIHQVCGSPHQFHLISNAAKPNQIIIRPSVVIALLTLTDI